MSIYAVGLAKLALCRQWQSLADLSFVSYWQSPIPLRNSLYLEAMMILCHVFCGSIKHTRLLTEVSVPMGALEP